MLYHDSRRVVGWRTVGGNGGVVGGDTSCRRGLKCPRHLLLHRATSRIAVGIKLDSNRGWTDIFQEDLHGEVVLIPLGLHADVAEADCVQLSR